MEGAAALDQWHLSVDTPQSDRGPSSLEMNRGGGGGLACWLHEEWEEEMKKKPLINEREVLSGQSLANRPVCD